MSTQSSRHYARLLNAQKLLKARDEADLALLKRELTVLEEENNLLSAMMARGSYADFVDPLLISQRMERNHRTQARLKTEIEAQIKIWLQSSNRHRRIAEKQAKAQAHEARAELAEFLGEVIAHSFHAH